MQRGIATLQLPTPFEVGRAIASQGRYHFGIPDEGLSVQAWFPASNGPYLEASAPLKAGDVYVATLADWLGWLAGAQWSDEAVQLALRRASTWSRAAALTALFGYLPVKVKIPALGGPVTFSPHGKIVAIGGWGSSSGALLETFSFGMSYDVVGADVGAMPNTLDPGVLGDIAQVWADFISKATIPGPAFSTEIWLTEVAYYRVQSDGTSTTGTWQRHFLSPPGQGTQTTDHKPFQDALVVTLDAGGARGGRFGRFYLPAPALPLALGTFAPSAIEILLGDVADALAAVNGLLTASLTDDVELVVASARGDGENRPVRSLRIGVVPDTQRRRRRSLDENYQVTPFQSV